MRLRIRFSITIGDKRDAQDEDRYVDAMGHLEPAGDVDTGVGFTTPGMTPRWGDE